MSEKEIAKKPRRAARAGKQDAAAPDEVKAVKKTTPKKTAKSKSQAAAGETVDTSKDLVIDAASRELKPAKRPRAKRKTLAEIAETPAVPGAGSQSVAAETAPSSAELTAVAGGELAEAVQTVEQIIGAAAAPPLSEAAAVEVKPKRKKTPVKKAKPAAPSSDTLIKKTATAKKTTAGAKRQKSETTEAAAAVQPPAETEAAATAVPAAAEPLAAVEAVEVAAAAEKSPKREESPIFKELAEPKLPALPQQNRAWLQIQSPSRIFFYWSTRQNPFETLERAFPAGRAHHYRLAAKLINETRGTEDFYPVGTAAAGSWWFSVDAGSKYRVEFGFHSPQRPFIRLMTSNAVETPRPAPSPNRDWSMDFHVSADQFAEVLDASGYAQDAFEVAIAGDDPQTADRAARETFFQLTGHDNPPGGTSTAELRAALVAIAAGEALGALRERIGQNLYAALEAVFRENAEKLSADKVLAALQENFGFDAGELEEHVPSVFGASLVNFPKKFRAPRIPHVSSLR